MAAHGRPHEPQQRKGDAGQQARSAPSQPQQRLVQRQMVVRPRPFRPGDAGAIRCAKAGKNPGCIVVGDGFGAVAVGPWLVVHAQHVCLQCLDFVQPVPEAQQGREQQRPAGHVGQGVCGRAMRQPGQHGRCAAKHKAVVRAKAPQLEGGVELPHAAHIGANAGHDVGPQHRDQPSQQRLRPVGIAAPPQPQRQGRQHQGCNIGIDADGGHHTWHYRKPKRMPCFLYTSLRNSSEYRQNAIMRPMERRLVCTSVKRRHSAGRLL